MSPLSGQLQMFKVSFLLQEESQLKPVRINSGMTAGECECPTLWEQTNHSLDDELAGMLETVDWKCVCFCGWLVFAQEVMEHPFHSQVMIDALVKNVIHHLHVFPVTGGISSEFSLSTVKGKLVPDCNKQQRCAFGKHAQQASSDHDKNKQHDQTKHQRHSLVSHHECWQQSQVHECQCRVHCPHSSLLILWVRAG